MVYNKIPELEKNTTLIIETADSEYYADVRVFTIDINYTEFGGDEVTENREIVIKTDKLYEEVIYGEPDD